MRVCVWGGEAVVGRGTCTSTRRTCMLDYEHGNGVLLISSVMVYQLVLYTISVVSRMKVHHTHSANNTFARVHAVHVMFSPSERIRRRRPPSGAPPLILAAALCVRSRPSIEWDPVGDGRFL